MVERAVIVERPEPPPHVKEGVVVERIVKVPAIIEGIPPERVVEIPDAHVEPGEIPTIPIRVVVAAVVVVIVIVVVIIPLDDGAVTLFHLHVVWLTVVDAFHDGKLRVAASQAEQRCRQDGKNEAASGWREVSQ